MHIHIRSVLLVKNQYKAVYSMKKYICSLFAAKITMYNCFDVSKITILVVLQPKIGR